VLDTLMDLGNREEIMANVLRWARERESRYLCSSNVHSVVTARYDQSFLEVLNQADMTMPDGAAVAWAMRRQGFSAQQRVAGPDLMEDVLATAQEHGLKVFFYGSTQQTLDLLRERLAARYPQLQIAGMHSPPFGSQSEEQRLADAQMINDTGAQILLVGLGCPKQERWMRAQRGTVNAVMFGFGAAFDFHAGTLKRAPLWMQNHGLEWVHRLCSEPRRLWKRYLVTNSLFILGISAQLATGGGQPR
jgi:N-acetylglucosaminyldiphosphoundecaprenol N-acetyl-beta-D-mannosaminyltransferase